MTDADMQRQTRSALARDARRIAHEMGNILTVLYGVVEELQGDTSEVAVQNVPLLQGSIDKAREVAGAVSSLRERMLDGLTFQPRAIAAPLAPAVGVPRLVDAFDETASLQGEPALMERLILAVAVVAARSGGLVDVIPLHSPEDGRRDGHLRVGLEFGEPVPDALALLIESAVRDLGGAVRRDGTSVGCDLPAAPDNASEEG